LVGLTAVIGFSLKIFAKAAGKGGLNALDGMAPRWKVFLGCSKKAIAYHLPCYASKYISNDENTNHSKGQHQFYPDSKDKTEPSGDSHHPGLLYVSAGNELADQRADERAKKDADKPEKKFPLLP
jgi:hypothetical protein